MATIPDALVDDVARRFALLGDPTRLRVVRALHERGECTVGEIAESAGTSVANASQHLQRLAQGGIVGRRRDGQAIRYRIVDETIERLCDIVCGSVMRAASPAPSSAVPGPNGGSPAPSSAVPGPNGGSPAPSSAVPGPNSGSPGPPQTARVQ